MLSWRKREAQMSGETAGGAGASWLIFSLMTVVTWGLYGVFLHLGQTSMQDPVNGRYRAFLFVGIAYFLTAVLAPLTLLMLRGASWQFPTRGMAWSLVAGLAGATGAFCVLLAFGARGSPSVVMSIVFAGAPVVNAVTVIAMNPPQGGLGALRWQFIVGLLMAALGAFLVTIYKPETAVPSAARPGVGASIK
jgi:hypothetical protein